MLCLEDMDRNNIYFNNLENCMVSRDGKIRVPVQRKWGHAFIPVGSMAETIACNLTESQLRRISTIDLVIPLAADCDDC